MASPASALTPELTPSQSFSSSPSRPATPDSRPVDVVIAHYNESLDWLSSCADITWVYSKGERPEDPSIYRTAKTLPNIGRESHTYLYHIVKNYNHLADVTLFLQGNIHDINDGTPAHTELTLEQIVDMARNLTDQPLSTSSNSVVQAQNQASNGILPLGLVHTFSDWSGIQYLPGWIQRRGKTLQRSQFTPHQFWTYLTSGTIDPSHPSFRPPPKQVHWTQGALFAVTRRTIQKRPREVYERAFRYFDEMAKINPEEGHYMERFWLGIFGGDGIETMQSLGDGEIVEKATITGEEHAMARDEETVVV
jgi:hypothetical protein